MATSMQYKKLQQCVRKLRKALLPGKFDPTGTYRGADGTHLRAISFRILVHAEIESFIEDRAFQLFDEGWDAWATHRIPNRVLPALLAFSGHRMPNPPPRLGLLAKNNNKNNKEDIDALFKRVKKHWMDDVYKKNHGIKEANVLALLLPLGIDGSHLDTTLLADLTSFGGLRGAVAHKSSVRVTTYADPKSEYDTANQLVIALVSIDKLVGDALSELNKIIKVLINRERGSKGEVQEAEER